MEGDWKVKIALLMFLAIPAFGIWQYAKHYQLSTSEAHVNVSELSSSDSRIGKVVILHGFTGKAETSVVVGRNEFLVVESTSEGQIVVLRRHKKLEGSITERVSDGMARGYVSFIGKRRAEELGLVDAEFSERRIALVDVDRDYLGEIILLTFAGTLVGLVALGYVYLEADEQSFKERNRQSQTKSKVALQLAIAKQDLIRY